MEAGGDQQKHLWLLLHKATESTLKCAINVTMTFLAKTSAIISVTIDVYIKNGTWQQCNSFSPTPIVNDKWHTCKLKV